MSCGEVTVCLQRTTHMCVIVCVCGTLLLEPEEWASNNEAFQSVLIWLRDAGTTYLQREWQPG